MREAFLSRLKCASVFRLQASRALPARLGARRNAMRNRALRPVSILLRVVMLFFCALSIRSTRYAIGAEQPVPEVTEKEACAALPYATLSAKIYDHKKADDKSPLQIDEWKRVAWSRAAAGSEACEKAKDLMQNEFRNVSQDMQGLRQADFGRYMRASEDAKRACSDDPISFHAEAYQGPGGRLALIFEGTTFLSAKDWMANLMIRREPAQYAQGVLFADEIEKKCGSALLCEGGVVYAGHSLGGGLAQYAALRKGGTAYVFNAAGLWEGQAEELKPEVAGQAKVHLFYAVAKRECKWPGRDWVSKSGVQFMSAGRTFEVPVALPESITCVNAIHKMNRLVEGLSAACYSSARGEGGTTAISLIVDSSGSMIGYMYGPMGTVVRSTNKADLEKLDKAKEAVKAFILSRWDDESVSLSTFSGSGSTHLPLISVSEARKEIDSVLGRIQAGGGTNIGAGVEQGFEQLKSAGPSGSKMAILLSDGANTSGDWHAAVQKFKDHGWPICTVGFGTDADETTLRGIAEDTGCVYGYADIVDVVNKYQALSAYAEGKSTVLSVSEAIPPDGTASFQFSVGHANSMPTTLDVFSSWQGSKLSVVLTSPDGRTIDGEVASQGNGRYEEGDTFQMLQIQAPPPGKWKVEVSWSEPPTEMEQVNLLIAEKSDVFGRIHGFHSEYSSGQPVSIEVDADELLGAQKVPLLDASVSVKVQKPGAQMIQMVQAQSTNWVMYKDVLADVMREVVVSDDGNHGDYRVGDGTWGGTFRETDKNGSYLVTAIITGKKRDGTPVKKTLIASFQVGPIKENQITTSQTLQYVEQAKLHVDSTTPYSKEILQQPANSLEQMQGNAGDNIDNLLK